MRRSLIATLKRSVRLALAAAACALPLVAGSAKAQQSAYELAGMLDAQNAQTLQRMWQSYLVQYGPLLRQQYASYLAAGNPPLTFEQFAWNDVLASQGGNMQAALAAQRRRFEGLQQAHQAQASGGEAYIAAIGKNSAAAADATERYSRTGILGNAPYSTPGGAPVYLPYAQAPGQPVNAGGNAYVQDPSGRYYQLQGSTWMPMTAGR